MKFNKDNVQFIALLLLIGYSLFLQECRQGTKNEQPIYRVDTLVKMDTILPPPVIVKLPQQQIPAPTIIYIDSTKNIVHKALIDTSKHRPAHVYQDSLEDENLTLYYSSIVNGELLKNSLDYRLKIPKQITKTVEITKPVPLPVSSLLLTGSVGTSINSFNSVRLGLQFVSAKGWALGYDYDLLQNIHSVNLGVKLVQFPPKGAKKKKRRNFVRNFF
ncbi:hypothetical protein [Aureispira anguillae]|uniref:Uncharacterized protein n=1 Tax=Aureispira anguillae TaxID=2864201 RepID=A0A915YDB2_9BACT|nr:hypothetical protein [Aureispira anguillae]BDS10965.1 hypothetical protein AsAng_0016750 [Aureispira anguillae]